MKISICHEINCLVKKESEGIGMDASWQKKVMSQCVQCLNKVKEILE